MKHILFFFFLLVLFSIPILAANPYYTWIGQNSSELKSELGNPEQIACNEQTKNDTMYVYKTDIGYMSYMFHDLKIYHANMTTYWKTKKQVNAALKSVLDMYKKDGLSVDKKSAKLTICSDKKYKVNIEVSFKEGWYGLSESASEIN
jgi:hypothetical protein